MTRILLRAKKGPFEAVSPETTLAGNLIGNNSGNLVFSHAVYKILFTPSSVIVPNRFRADPADAAEINAEYDVFVVPLANAFRLSFRDHLESLTSLIEQLRIPVVVFGVGAQGTLDYDATRLLPIEGEVRRFVRAVLDRSPSIGVRGEFTLDYLQRLGFRDVDVIGCPSMFLNGESLHVEKKDPVLERSARIAINISPYVKRISQAVVSHHRKYPNLTYIAQDLETLDLLLCGDDDAETLSPLPVHTSHPFFRENKVRFFTDPWPWLSYLADVDFSFGTRIHGNITALVAGTPAYVLAHDSRTLELARHYEIPHLKLTNPVPEIDAARLYEEADFSGLNKGHKERFAAVLDFLDKHGLDHAYAAGGDGGARFDELLQQTTFPPPVDARTTADTRALTAGVRWLKAHGIKPTGRVHTLKVHLKRRQPRRRRKLSAIRRQLRRLLGAGPRR